MKKGFTLVEMLVVIAILGILMAMMIPAAGMILKRSKIARARADAGVVATVLLKYQAEYNRWPGLYVKAVRDTTDADWVNTMAPKPEGATLTNNYKRIVFFEPGGGALATNGVYKGAFVDPWGNPYVYRLDQEGSGDLLNPDEIKGGRLRTRVAAWSWGPDGKSAFTNGHDNVMSWE